MEDIWKDLSLAGTPTGLHHLRQRNSPVPFRAELPDNLAVPQPPTPPPPLEFAFLSSGAGPQHVPNSNAAGSGSKRHGDVAGPPGGGADRRQRRMIKNRESAARSRARKQAYANQLEAEVVQLQREKETLIKRIKARLAMAEQVSEGRPALRGRRSASTPP